VKAAIRFAAFSSEVSSKQHEMAAGFGAALTEIFRGLEQISRPLCHEAGHGAIGNTQFMQTASADDCRSRRARDTAARRATTRGRIVRIGSKKGRRLPREGVLKLKEGPVPGVAVGEKNRVRKIGAQPVRMRSLLPTLFLRVVGDHAGN
jgi:hypothetical protein